MLCLAIAVYICEQVDDLYIFSLAEYAKINIFLEIFPLFPIKNASHHFFPLSPSAPISIRLKANPVLPKSFSEAPI
jgi:hypothetical protein